MEARVAYLAMKIKQLQEKKAGKMAASEHFTEIALSLDNEPTAEETRKDIKRSLCKFKGTLLQRAISKQSGKELLRIGRMSHLNSDRLIAIHCPSRSRGRLSNRRVRHYLSVRSVAAVPETITLSNALNHC